MIDFAQQNIVLFAVFGVLLIAIITMELRRLTKKYQDITPTEMVNLINHDGAVVFDFRERVELTSGTIQGAKHIAPVDLPRQLDQLTAYKEAPVIGFCAQGIKAPSLCRELTKQGFLKVYHLKGGITAWKQANMPIVTA